GIVLVARISVELGSEKAGIYGLGMAIAVFVALRAYVKYPADSPLASFDWAIHLGLIMLIWWCAHRLTWDCTHIDDVVDASGKGVLEAAGLDEQVEASASSRNPQPSDEELTEPESSEKRPG